MVQSNEVKKFVLLGNPSQGMLFPSAPGWMKTTKQQDSSREDQRNKAAQFSYQEAIHP